MTLREKTLNGLFWSFVDNFSRQGLTFVIGIILARILTPRDFGLVGMITIFIALSKSLMDSGFTQALIRKKACTQADFSTVFYFNFLVSILLYLVLFISATGIGDFFKEPKLILLVRVVGIGIIIEAFSIVQRAILIKNIDFKLQAKISILATIASGIIGVIMAFKGFGVWSLVARNLTEIFIISVLLWVWNRWKPSFVFNRNSFNEMFSFGYKLLLSGLIDTVYRNIYLLIIGKYLSAADLGYYTRANQFSNLPSQNLSSVIQRVSFPVLTEMNEDSPRLRVAYQQLIKSTMLISFVLMLGMAAVAKPMIITLIGEKWLPSVVYLQLLCFVGMLYPIQSLNLNILNVKGRSDLFLRLEIIKKIFAIPIIFIGIFIGVKAMILGMFFLSFLSYYLNSYYSGKLINYGTLKQIKDIIPSFTLAFIVSLVMYVMGEIINLSPLILLIIQISTGAILTIGLCELMKLKDYLFLKKIVLDKFFSTNLI